MSQLRLVFDPLAEPIMLESVGTYFRPSDLATCPEGTFTESNIFYLNEITNCEWWHNLTQEDRAILKKYFNVDEYLLRSFGTSDMNEYMEKIQSMDIDREPAPWYVEGTMRKFSL